jgi:hypothetical protein
LRTSDVERIIENLENALRVHPEKGYEVGTLEEAEKFRNAWGATENKNWRKRV